MISYLPCRGMPPKFLLILNHNQLKLGVLTNLADYKNENENENDLYR